MNSHITLLTGKANKKYVLDKPGAYLFFLHNFSGEIETIINNADINVTICGVYIGEKNDQYHVKTIQNHAVGRSISDLFIKGVFFDYAKLQYEGLIKICTNAQLSNAYQKNQNLIMSPNAYVASRPYLEIEANDVRCTHGSTTGKLDQLQISYLFDRGISKKDAEKMLIEGFINEVFEKAYDISGKHKKISNLHDTIVNSLYEHDYHEK